MAGKIRRAREKSKPKRIGIAVGLPLAFAAAQLLRSGLDGLEPFEPVTFLGVAALLVAVALLASAQPARRAARVGPMVALRCE